MVPSASTTLPQDACCHMLGVKVPLKYLNCSHLFQKHWHRHVRDFGLSSINSGKNILVLLKILKRHLTRTALFFSLTSSRVRFDAKSLIMS
ncbi:expressed protein [Batrachochytrium dendrobatidis JAM81]|uniref:Expressed protein n=1 Tax=Batrachochytrium dendrobatidis (strain JAM81 / FGSC 10211) TaxID=684364 RepID=F4PDH7_BATDJ|nr:uncharacterized protein BATDEDRAFT_37524 [Batrachochytrium dendrobatidis JAM81]EGF76679.1 expressed protein [Batrachochytrium dendrobatidis JAM81]|eukprot:XP_006682668.1 expressed protein [Batrachochytrium dendrobatidis JAM81]